MTAADIPAYLLTPLRECPVGSRVVHEGEVYVVAEHDAHLTVVALRRSVEELWCRVDTPVLLLEGAEPRPLREDDVGQWVMVDPAVLNTGLRNQVVRVRHQADDGDWMSHEGFRLALEWPCWRIVEPAEVCQSSPAADAAPQDAHTAPRWVATGDPDDPDGWLVRRGEEPWLCSDMEMDHAKALADHLNSGPDGPWTPPEPEPERLTPDQVGKAWQGGYGYGDLSHLTITEAFAQHGFVVVDRRGLLGDGDVAWLRRMASYDHFNPLGSIPVPTVRRLLAALYPDEAATQHLRPE